MTFWQNCHFTYNHVPTTATNRINYKRILLIKAILNLNEFNKKIFLLNSSKKTVSISTLFTS